jgi:large subunit ribosomal protein L2
MKKLVYGFHFAAGRNNGLISSYHRGGANKRRIRFIDRFRFLYNIPGKILKVIPNSNSPLALVLYTNGYLSYLPALSNFKERYISSIFSSSNTLHTKVGLSCPIKLVKTGSHISSVELYPSSGSKICRSSGLFCTLIRKYGDLALLKLPSGEYRFFSVEAFCTIGSILGRENRALFKAGQNRWKGKRPIVRGRAMNPVDHPHGGRTRGGMVPTTPWGRIAKGKKTSTSTSLLRLRRRR